MIALVRSETRRLFSRRIVKALVLLTLAGISLTCVLIAVNSDSFAVRNVPTVLEGTSFLIAIGGWLVGSSFVGAEWQAGSMATLLTWEPRRLRVLTAKVAACAAGVFVVALALEVAFASAMWLVAASRGGTEGANGSFLRDLALLMLRISGVTAFGAVLGLSLATIARNTGAAIGFAFAYLAIGESIIRALKPAWQPWLIGDNANIVVLGGDQSFPPIGRSVGGSAFVLVLYAAVLFVAASGSFRARDVN